MKDMNWPERVAYLENQLADSDRDNRRLRGRLAEAEREARVLVVAMADQCGASDNWKPLPDVAGMITQINNMVAGLREERALIVARAENAEAALVEANETITGIPTLCRRYEARLAEAEARFDKDVIERNRVIAEKSTRLAEAEDSLAIARFNCEAQAQANINLEARLAEAEALLRESFDWVGREPVPFDDVPRVLTLRKRIDAHLARKP
jgi:DNA repair ATPase RecN